MRIPYKIVAIFALAMSSTAFSQEAPSQLKVMTFNIRYDNPKDGPNAWPHRKELVAKAISSHSVDIVGMQEVLQRQQKYLAKQLDQYATYGVGRDDGGAGGEFNSIYYRKQRFELLDQSTFWLSETPEVVGSQGWDARLSRIVSWVKLRDRVADRNLFFFNTHFSHVGHDARKNGALLLVRKIAEIAGDDPVILAGDFNCRSQSEPYRILTGNWQKIPQLFDTHFVSESGHFGGMQTINGFSDKQPEAIIDFLFCNSHWKVVRNEILPIRERGVFVSDHYPVLATIELLKNKPVTDKTSAKPLPD